MSSLKAHALWLTAGLCLALCTPPEATAKVYKWVDENGVVHYTMDRDEIPPQLRRRLRPALPADVAPPERAPELSEPLATPDEFRDEPEMEPTLDPALEVEPESEPPPVTAGLPPRETLSGTNEIAELEAEILSYREELKTLISSSSAMGTDFAENPRVREIAERLPRLQAQLQALQREAAR
jgi:hypothetical protein